MQEGGGEEEGFFATQQQSKHDKGKYKEVVAKYQISKSMIWKWCELEQGLNQEADEFRA